MVARELDIATAPWVGCHELQEAPSVTAPNNTLAVPLAQRMARSILESLAPQAVRPVQQEPHAAREAMSKHAKRIALATSQLRPVTVATDATTATAINVFQENVVAAVVMLKHAAPL